MVRERQPPRMPGRVSHAPIIISDDDEGESIFEVSTSPMPRADQMRRLDTSRLPAKSRLQQEVDLESSSSDSDIDDSSIMSSKQDEPTQHKQDQKQQIPNEIPAKDGSNKDDNDESLEKFMESLKLAPKPANNASQKPEQQQQKAHIFEARTPGPKPGAPYPILNSAQPNRTQPGNQPKTISYSSVKTITNPLLIPKKKNPPSQEHYRPDPRTHDQPKFGQVSALQSPIAHHRPEQFRQKQSMYGPPQTPASKPQNSGGAVSIFRPTNKTITTPAAPRTIFSSKPTSKKPMSNIDMFTRLTNSRFEKPVTYKSDEFSSGDSDDSDIDGPIDSGDIYTYVDPEKANENLKALLEGALEDEEDKKPRTRSRKKKADKAVDDLAKRLETVKVEEGKDDSKEESPTLQNNIKPADVGVKDDEVEGEDEEEEEDDGTVEGLNIKLLPHQIDGVAWMRDKEIGKKKTRGVHPKGGILADDMGLGKTVQSIALILTNPRPPVDKEPVKEKEKGKGKKKKGLSPDVGKGTLIIAPLALIKQWEGEIESRVERSHRLLTCVYHGPQKNKYSDELHKYDVVITTYGTLSAEHAAWGKETIKKGIFKNTWYRIILDEAHTIKNRNAKATQAACALDSEYRWCLTGTPMQNNLEELQSLIHFLRIKPYENLTTFKEQIIKPLNNGRGTLAIRRLQVVLKAFMKRRTKDVLKEGGGLHGNKPEKKDAESGVEKKPSGGFKIVNREVIKIAAEFTPEEREFYDRLQHRTDKTLEKMAGSKLNYASALVLLLRLRQACNHPDLVNGDLAKDKDGLFGNVSSQKSDTSVDDVADLMGGLSMGPKMCDVCQKTLNYNEASKGRCSECVKVLGSSTLLQHKTKQKKMKRVKKDITKPKEEASQSQRARNRRVVLDSDDDDDDEEDGKPSDSEDEYTYVTDSDASSVSDSEDDVVESTASTKVQNLMKVLKDEAPKFKFIVFSFFTSMLDKVEPFLKASKIGYARYDGGMRNDLREASLNRLRNAPECRVLLCSLRAGSLGLNLTAASRVVILEPFWNPFVEEQAIDRVHRLNQTVDVKIYKFTIKDTVEERILDLQEKKRELANATIEGKQAAGKLSMQDMLALFQRDAETRYRADDNDNDFNQRVKVLHNADELTSYEKEFLEKNKSTRRSGGVMERDRKNRRAAQENSVFGRRWD